jgi:hypothetical protein
MEISWDRVRRIFGYPEPPREVWERQFDYCDDDLRRVANTPFEQINSSDLSYYYHDLAYVELQPELFAYLFPVCLMDWHATLLRDEGCWHGDSEFHYGVYQGKVFEKMVSPEQKMAIFEFFRDSFLLRLERQRGFLDLESKSPLTRWIRRFTSLGIIMPRIDLLWDPWWALETLGSAVASIQYLSGLMYFEGENPIFGPWTSKLDGPYLWENDSQIYASGWTDENVSFLQESLTVQFVSDKLQRAVEMLKDEPEYKIARQVGCDLSDRTEIIESRISELPTLLSSWGAEQQDGWSV